MSEFKINILPFNILKEHVVISFSTEEKEECIHIKKNDLPKNFPNDKKETLGNSVWWSTDTQAGDITVSVNLFENKRFAKHYFNKILFDHFHNQNILTNRNFIKDTEVWIEETEFHNNDFKKYNKFTLRIDNNDLIEGTSMLVSYDGDSFILTRNLAATPLESAQLGKVKYQERITKFEDLNATEQADRNNIFPIHNRDIKRVLNLDAGRNFSENKYKRYYTQIHQFYETYLKNALIGECIKIFESGFYKPYDEKVKPTSEDSNLLLFGNNQKNFTPYIGLKEYGPIQSPPIDKAIKFIFIFHEEDKELANKVYSYLKKGYKSFPGLESFVKIQFEIDTAKTLRFTDNNPISEITTALANLQLDTANNAYAALYISRIKKDTEDEEDDAVYFRLKELLLNHGITSQVIFKDNINNPSFNYFLPNIAIALLAKLGGIPWRLYRPIKNDLVVGIGADRSIVAKNKFIGSAFCFKNDGSFKGFNAFESGDTTSVANSIKEKIGQYIAENKQCDRLVVHYYKNISWREEKPIRDVLDHLNFSLPYVIVTINETESKDYVLFDSSFDGKMPQSGTFIKTKRNEFILCNNTRYSNKTGTRIDGFPLPVKIKFKSSNYEKIDDDNVVKELIDQVYQFSRMYWKSVRQRNMPVTIEYSQIVAKMISHFNNKELEQFARNTLWFL
ncbi:MAG: Piwi domain-containing protein [Ignavibacteria bacterium]|nr:Piwi domain-containing protein [Ignavibacteria bacterium]